MARVNLMEPRQINELFDYTYWAFDRVWSGISQLSDTQFTEDLGYSHGSIRNIVVHLISSHRRWLLRLQGMPLPPHLRFDDFPSLEAVRSEWDEARDEFLKYTASLSEAHLSQIVHHAMPDRGIESAPERWEVLLHLVNHATDHRSQILALLNGKFGIATPEHDFIIYLWERGNPPTKGTDLTA